MATFQLLTQADGPAVTVDRAEGSAPFVLVCEHASKVIPERLGDLGVRAETRSSHAAWDPGALAVAVRLSNMLDAPLVAQRFSRLVYDCNRPPESPTAMPVRSEIHDIPANAAMTADERQARIDEIYLPWRNTLAAVIEKHAAKHPAGLPVVVTVHSYTPVYHGVHRSGEIGILHDSDSRFADALLSIAGDSDRDVRRNYPYGPVDGVTHTLVEHAQSRGLLNVMIEIRNDLIQTVAGQAVPSAVLYQWWA